MAGRTEAIVADLLVEREEFLAALEAIDPDGLTRPGLVGDWSAKELIAHMGYWAGRAVDLIQAAERGGIETFGEGRPSVDDINATVARVARDTDLATVQARERASVEALVERLQMLDPTLLDLRLSDGTTVEKGIREDAGDHFREHAQELREALGRER